MTATVIDLDSYRRVRRPNPAATEWRWASQAHAAIDAAEELLIDGHTAEVLEFCDRATGCLKANAGDIDDPSALDELTGRLDTLHARARRESHRHPVFRAGRARPLVTSIGGGASGPSSRPARSGARPGGRGSR